MMLFDERNRIIEVSNKLIAANVIHTGQGNISIFDRKNSLVAITPSAVPYEERDAEDICIIDLAGDIVEGKWKPTSELLLHLIYYKKREDINAVIHTHAPKATVFGVLGTDPIPMILNEAAMGIGGAVPIAPYARPGSDELAQITYDVVGDGFAAIMAHHGLITLGATIDLAYTTTMAVESTADTIIMARSMGVEPTAIEDAEVKNLREMFLGYRPGKV